MSKAPTTRRPPAPAVRKAKVENRTGEGGMNWAPKPYANYRPFQSSWIPRLPEHWRPLRAKYVVREIDDRSTLGTEVLLSMRQYRGLVPHNDVSTKIIPASFLVGYKRAKPNDLVLNRMQASNSMFFRTALEGVVSPDYAVFRPEVDVSTEYLGQLFRSVPMCGQFRAESKGLGTGTSGFLRLYSDRFSAIPIPLPPRDEQDQIVAYLSALDAQVARFIRDKRRLIEVLSEQKQTLIHHAVTRGLDPSARLKPSGMEWLGAVPEHWRVMPLKAAATVAFSGVDKRAEEDEIPVLLCNYTDVYRNEQITRDLPFMKATASRNEIARFTLHKGDVLMTKDSETPDDIGVPAWVSEEINGVVCGYHLAMLRPRPAVVDGAFLYRALCSPRVASQFHVAATGVTRFGLAKRDIQNAIIAVPPVPEQVDIVKWLAREAAELDRVISGAKSEIDLMREYRDRLVADVVTGQLDVRGWLPGPDDVIGEAAVVLDDEDEAAISEQGAEDDDDGHE